ncbi:MAG: acyloxyacyl hydrolase [Flavobacteriaceae bacterium]|nr:acyloxyacyl hydrolase [Flavobacteriaceae bacterium]
MRTLYLILFVFTCSIALAQEGTKEKTKASSVDVNYFYGNIANHNPDILHLITGHPEGIIVSWNQKTFGNEAWEARYNYPDVGYSFIYQDLKNEYLGDNLGLYAHYNFYFLKRNLVFRIGQGLAIASNPYDKQENFRNIAFGSKILSSTYVMLNYQKENLFNSRFGIQTGLSLVHYSNANVKAPNTSVNTIAFNFGVNYNLDDVSEIAYKPLEESGEKFTQPIKYNIVFRSGVNESDVVGTGQFPFYVFSGYADKRLSHKSALQLGTDVFLSQFLKEDIKYNAAAFPDRDIDPDSDYKRIGVFVGHELFINKMSLVTQIGYYAYLPYEFESSVYQRIGLKRYFGEKWFGALTLKTHAAKAEALEFGVGIRL